MIQILIVHASHCIVLSLCGLTLLGLTTGNATAAFPACAFAQQQDDINRIKETDSAIIESAEQAVKLGFDFLVSQQSADGAWRSKNYGAMKQGAANTSLVLYALSHLPEDKQKRFEPNIELAKRFLLTGIEKKGCVANPDGSFDYPVYSTAMILTANRKLNLGLSKTQTDRMIDFLLASQCVNERGFEQANLNFGGWDILGPGSTQGKTAGANVSVTFYVSEAFSHYQSESIRIAKQRTVAWCERILNQSTDGGFYFTSQLNSTLNKAGWHDDKFKSPRSYGSATCDGLSILLTIGDTSKTNASEKAISWIGTHGRIESVPGFKGESDVIGWPSSLRFYYLAALSRSMLLGSSQKWAGITTDLGTEKFTISIQHQLVDTQRDSGAWQNDYSRMREDDPLIATPFALIALLNCQESADSKSDK